MTQPRIALVSCMRNEGIFLLEWVAYHAGLGFDDIVIITNDCTDGSDLLLDKMQEMGLLTHIRQSPPEGAAVQDAGMDLAFEWFTQNDIDWALHIDSDEFLNITKGAGLLCDLMQGKEHGDLIALPWRAFGDSGLTDWYPGASVLMSFTKAEAAPDPEVTKYKSLFRPARFTRATDHNPLEPRVADPVVLNGDGQRLHNRSLYRERSSRFKPADLACTTQTACLNHYAVKSSDLFLMKNDRGDGQGKTGERKYYLNSRWHRLANVNEVEDRSILRHWPATDARLCKLRRDPDLAELEQACFDWFLTRRAEILTPENLAAWTLGKAKT